MPSKFKPPILRITRIRTILEKNGYKQDEKRHRHLKYINEKGQEITMVSGSGDCSPAIIRQIVNSFAKHNNISDEEAFTLLFGKKNK